MSLFRSEEHLVNWLARTGYTRGAVLTVEQTWRLAQAWYVDPRDPAWRPRTIDESQAVLASVGLRGDIWQLRP
ncbi:MAG TPA: hypothetical protein VGD27_00220 [Longimicrobiales bacterium]